MTGPTDSDSPDSLTDPETLLDGDDCTVETHTDTLDAEDFADAVAWESHVAAGVADDRGVLCYDDGHHGWTLPAFTVADGEDYLAVARREFEALTGVPVSIERVEHARRRRFSVEADGDDRQTDVWNVVVRATPAEALPDDPASREDGADLRWFDGVPATVEGVVAADIERVLAD